MSVEASFSVQINYPAATYTSLDPLGLDTVNFLSGQNTFMADTLIPGFDPLASGPNSAVSKGAFDAYLGAAALIADDNAFTADYVFNEITARPPVNDDDLSTYNYVTTQLVGGDAATLKADQTFTAENTFQAGATCSKIQIDTATCDATLATTCVGPALYITDDSNIAQPINVGNILSNGALIYPYPIGGPKWTRYVENDETVYLGNGSSAVGTNVSFSYTFIVKASTVTNIYLPDDAHLGQVVNFLNIGSGTSNIFFGDGTNTVGMVDNWGTYGGSSQLAPSDSATYTFIGTTPVASGGNKKVWFLINKLN